MIYTYSDALNRINEKLNAPRLNTPVIIVIMTNGLFSFNKSRMLPKMVVKASSFFMATSFTKKNKIITAIAPGMRDKRKTACISMI